MGIWTDDPSGGGGGAREAIRLYEFNGIEVGTPILTRDVV